MPSTAVNDLSGRVLDLKEAAAFNGKVQFATAPLQSALSEVDFRARDLAARSDGKPVGRIVAGGILDTGQALLTIAEVFDDRQRSLETGRIRVGDIVRNHGQHGLVVLQSRLQRVAGLAAVEIRGWRPGTIRIGRILFPGFG